MAEVLRSDPALHARLAEDPIILQNGYVRAEVTVKPCIDPALPPLEGTRLRVPCMTGKWDVSFTNLTNAYSGSWEVPAGKDAGPMSIAVTIEGKPRTAVEICTVRVMKDVNVACSPGKFESGEGYDADRFVLQWSGPNLLTGSGFFYDSSNGNRQESLASVSFRKVE